MSPVARLRLELLGGFQARLAEGPVIGIAAKKTRALLAYLALAAGRRYGRDKLADLLWSDRGDKQARDSLRQALVELRDALADIRPPLLTTDHDLVSIDPAAVEVDALQFERLAAHDSADELRHAVALYHGDLLDGLGVRDPAFEDWLRDEQQRYRELMVAVLKKLLAHETGATAIAIAQRLLALDPLQEEGYRALMRLHAEAGDIATALRQYDTCCATLKRELDIAPSPETKALHRQIKDQSTARPGNEIKPALGRRQPKQEVMLGFELRGVHRRLAAVVSADVVGYSRLVERDEEGTVRRLKENWRTIVRPAIERHSGRAVKLMGDGALIEFPSVVEAVRFSLEIQQEAEAAEAPRPDEVRIRYRIGVHLGDVIIDGEDIQGHGVNVSARLQGLAEPGGICLSETVRTALGHSLPLAYDDLGPQEVKNIAEPVRAYRIRAGGRAEKTRPAEALRRRIMAVPLLLGVLATVIAAAGGAYFAFYWKLQQQTPEPATGVASEPARQAIRAKSDLPSIVVLPFTNLSGDKAQEFFVDGLTEDLIVDLSRVSGLFVISRHTAFTYKDQPIKPQQIASDLHVRYLLSGSVRRSADRLRVTAELTDAANDRQIWADNYDHELADIFAVQDDVKSRIIAALSITLTPGERTVVEEKPTKNIEAYDYYLRGRYAMNDTTRRSLRLAYYAFEKAVALDPSFAEAQAALAMTYALDYTGTYHWNDGVRSPARARTQAEIVARKAAALSPRLAAPDLVLARIALAEWRYDDALDHARRAVEREPGDPEAHATLALMLTAAGQHAEANRAIEEALRRDPKAVPSTYTTLGIIQFGLGDYEAALKTLEDSFRQMTVGANWLFDLFEMAAAGYGNNENVLSQVRTGLFWNKSLAAARFSHFYRNEGDMEKLLEGLRLAGVPEFNANFDRERDSAQPVTGPALSMLLSGRKFETLCWGPRLGGEFRFSTDGDFTWTLRHDLTDTGTSRIGNSHVCVKTPVITRDREACYSVFRIESEWQPVRDYDYVFAGPRLCYFREKN